MLQIIRSGLNSIFVKALFVLLIASFAIWGVGDIFGGPPAGRAAIEVDDVRYSVQDVATEFDRSRAQLGAQIDARTAIQIGLLDRVIDQLSTSAVLQAEANDLGLGVGDAQAAEYIRNQFVDDLGNFNRSAFETALFRGGFNSEAAYVDQLRHELTRNMMLASLIASEAAPDPVIDQLFAYRETRRSGLVASIDPASLPEPEAPTDAELRSYYEDAGSRYETPELRAVTWVSISPEAIGQTLTIDDETLRRRYEDEIDRFTQEEVRDLEQMLLLDQETAETAYERIQSGEDFYAVAQDLAGMDEAGTKLGKVTRDDLLDGTVEAVFSLDQGTVSEPVESDLGWHLFRVLDIEEGGVTPFEEVHETLLAESRYDRALDLVFEQANAFEDELAGGATLEEAAAKLQLPVETTPAIDSAGRDPSGVTIDALPGGDFLDFAFDTEQGRQSALGEDGDGFFVLRVDGVDPARVPDLAEIRDRVLADWKADERLSAAETLAETTVDRVNNGENLDVIAAADGFGLSELPPLTRNGQGLPSGFPRDLVGALFDIDSEGRADFVTGENRVFVVQLSGIDEADPSANDLKRDGVAEQIATGMRSDVVELLVADLLARRPVETDRDAVASVYTAADQQ